MRNLRWLPATSAVLFLVLIGLAAASLVGPRIAAGQAAPTGPPGVVAASPDGRLVTARIGPARSASGARAGQSRPASRQPTDGARPEPYAPAPTGEVAVRSVRPPPIEADSRTAQGATDLTMFRTTSLADVPPDDGDPSTASYLSTTSEPSVAQFGDRVFYVANWFAAHSNDGGQSFTFVAPETFGSPPAVGDRFCCDQLAIYVPQQDLFVWLLQYEREAAGSPQAGNNSLRIAVAPGATWGTEPVWTYWDVTPQQVGLPTNRWFDYNQIAFTDRYLYVTSNVFVGSSGTSAASSILRLPLSELAARAATLTVTARHFTLANADLYGTTSPVVCAAACSTAYFAQHYGTSSLRIWSWPDAAGVPTSQEVGHSSYVRLSRGSLPGLCLAPDGTNMCGFLDDRIATGWSFGNTIGFAWTAGQGAVGTTVYPYPYAHVVRIDVSSAAYRLRDEPIAWSRTSAVAYPAVAANGRGDLAMSAAIGGATLYPSAVAFVLDDLSASTTTWTRLDVSPTGTNGPARNRWGDYLQVRAWNGNGNSWVATGFVLTGPCTRTDHSACDNVAPLYFSFGRGSDEPASSPPTPTPTVTGTPDPSGSATATATATPTSTPTPTPGARLFVPASLRNAGPDAD